MATFGSDDPILHASLLQLAAILRSAVDAIISIDVIGRIESVNPAAEKLFGYQAADLVGQNVKILMPEPYQAQHDNYIRHYLHTGQRKIIGIGREVTGLRRDGSTFPMHLSVSEYEVDGAMHFAGIVHDLTSQKLAEAQSARQQTLFEAIVNNTPLAIILADQNRRIVLSNPSVETIFGYGARELSGQQSRVLYATEDDYQRVWKNSTDGTAGIEPIGVSCRRKDGEVFPAEVVATVVKDRDQNTLGFMRLFRDISRQVHQDEALRRAQRMDALGQLTGGIAHDFNNLLTIILGNLEQVEEATDINELREFTRRANDAAEMGARLTKRLLGFSRQRKLEPTLLELNSQILGMSEMLQRSIGEMIELTTALDEELWTVRADPSEIENAVLNLATNARDAMPSGGRIHLETRNVSLAEEDIPHQYGLMPGDYVQVAVSDNGHGMPSDVVARAFEPFFTTKPAGSGTGLGLASIYGFVKQSGGNITLYSEIGRGTTVNLYLPRFVAAKPTPSASTPEGTSHQVTERVLVVEDNPDLRVLTLQRLQRLGYAVEEADGGPSALEKLRAIKVDILFSDVVMPGGLTGYELAARARALNPTIRILLTSGYDAELAAAQDTTMSSLKVLRKPYKQSELARALREVLSD